MSVRRTPGVPRPHHGAIPVLDAIRVSWEWLCTGPHPVSVDGSGIDGLADRRIPLDELRAQLLDRSATPALRDAVWGHLITRSRQDGPTWTVACAGMALPMLAALCREMTVGFAGDRADVCSAIVTGFVAAVAEIDPARPGLATSLRWAARRGGLAAVREALDAPSPHPHDRLVHAALRGNITTPDRDADPPRTGSSEDAEPGPARTRTGRARAGRDHAGPWVSGRGESTPPPAAAGHPDLVLAQAVATGVISVAEATLIGVTRLERVPLAVIAARRGRAVGAVTMQRLRAEMRLLDHLRAADLDDPGGAPDPGSSPTATAQPRRRDQAVPGSGQGPESPSVSGPRRRRRDRNTARSAERVTR